jgi:hypothetical protein
MTQDRQLDEFLKWLESHPGATLRDAWNGAVMLCRTRLMDYGQPSILRGLASPPPLPIPIVYEEPRRCRTSDHLPNSD